jgi:hypothetical protein
MNGRLPLYVLFAGCALFAGILFLELTAPDEAESSTIQAAAPHPGIVPVPLRPAEANIEALVAATLARPLFSPTRRPAGKSDDTGSTAGLGDSRLTGIVTLPHHGIAIFAVPGANPLVVSEGDSVSGWHVDSINPEEVAVTGPEGSKTLRPKSDPALAAPAQRVPQGEPGLVPNRPLAGQMPRPLSPIPPGMRPSLPRMPPGILPPVRH